MNQSDKAIKDYDYNERTAFICLIILFVVLCATLIYLRIIKCWNDTPLNYNFNMHFNVCYMGNNLVSCKQAMEKW